MSGNINLVCPPALWRCSFKFRHLRYFCGFKNINNELRNRMPGYNLIQHKQIKPLHIYSVTKCKQTLQRYISMMR